MERTSDHWLNPDARMNWPMALLAGLAAGAIIWLLSHGMPWFASGMISPTLMGRDLKPAGVVDPAGSAMTVLAQAFASVVYTVIIALVVHRLRGLWAVAAGAVIGLILYALNFVVFYALADIAWSNREFTVIVTHIVFGAVAAGLYKGMAARRMLPTS